MLYRAWRLSLFVDTYKQYIPIPITNSITTERQPSKGHKRDNKGIVLGVYVCNKKNMYSSMYVCGFVVFSHLVVLGDLLLFFSFY